MPYIRPEYRRAIDSILKRARSLNEFFDSVKSFWENHGEDDGIYAYIIYKLVVRTYAGRRWKVTMNAVKVLDGVKDEYLRQHVHKGEDAARTKHGDVR